MLARLRFLTAGESHGPLLTAVLEGLPAGFRIDSDRINAELARRQRAFGSGGRMKIEKDEVRITAGFMNGHTTGGPMSFEVQNRDWKNWATKDIKPMTTPRPGHADLTGAIKYGFSDLRLSLERASARETTMRVVVGSVCRQILAEFGVEIGGYVRSIGEVSAALPETPTTEEYRQWFARAAENDLACPDQAAYDSMRQVVQACMKAKDTLGGVFEVVALHVPPGLGSYVHWERRLEARLGMALLSIQAMKGVEFGPAFENARKRGTQVHDEIFRNAEGNLIRKTNRAAGFEGGISTGEPIVARVAMKPISTTLNPLRSVNLATGDEESTTYERSDFSAVPRAVPIGEAMVAIVLADSLMEKLGGDSREEMLPRFEQLRRSRLEDLAMANVPWRFGYR